MMPSTQKPPDPPQIPKELEYLAWFLGPKAENRKVFEEALTFILQDYVHWRVNYFPDDHTVVTREMERQFQPKSDILHENVHQMAAALRRNFPFYSPRYMGHMLSDVTMPSLLGYFAGMLYNPNNVTTEAAPVTVEWEIDACNLLLQMFGFKHAPRPIKNEDERAFAKRLPREFGWSHITFDGTTANLESLWVARTIKYLPLAALDVSMKYDLNVPELRALAGNAWKTSRNSGLDSLIGAQQTSLSRAILLLSPKRSLAILHEYLNGACQPDAIPGELEGQTLAERAWSVLRDSKFNVTTAGTSELFVRHPPYLFATGAAHYSLRKCADLLGIGVRNIKNIKMTDRFRMDHDHLKEEIDECISNGGVPLAVIAILGTTEEGAVDPVHEIVRLRTECEQRKENPASYWIHVDAAWGGFIQSLFNPDDQEAVKTMLDKIGYACGIEGLPDLTEEKAAEFRQHLQKSQLIDDDSVMAEVVNTLKELGDRLRHKEYVRLREDLAVIPTWVRGLGLDAARLRERYHQKITPPQAREEWMDLIDKIRLPEAHKILNADSLYERNYDRIYADVKDFMHETTILSRGTYHETEDISWHDDAIYSAFLALGDVDSIVCDPHKMGYGVYPCGVVLFRDNRVRAYVRSDAPYITQIQETIATNLPVRYPKLQNIRGKDETRVHVEGFGPFILEGSRPGAAASALHLSLKTIPPTRTGHGRIVRASLLAARELHAWLDKWDLIASGTGMRPPFKFVSLTPDHGPDTNVVTFLIADIGYPGLDHTNELTTSVYQEFSIQTELGERVHSYSQTFFISMTRAKSDRYPFSVFGYSLQRANLDIKESDYNKAGLQILRATVMNPYLYASTLRGRENFVQQFVESLAQTAEIEMNRLRKP